MAYNQLSMSWEPKILSESDSVSIILKRAAKFLVMILGGIAFVSALSGPGDFVNHVAHLGGMAVGFLYLRGRPFYFDFRNRYYRWRRLRLQRQFEVYMRKRDREQRPRGPWVQ